MSRLSAAVGLEKASLYHRFPKGKEQMAMAVAGRVVEWFTEHVFDVLKGPGTPVERVVAATMELRKFYADGTKACVLDMLSIPAGGDELAKGLMGAMHAWVGSFQAISEESGFEPEEAKARAEDAIMRIEGALIMSRVLGDPSAFHRTLSELPNILLKTPEGVR